MGIEYFYNTKQIQMEQTKSPWAPGIPYENGSHSFARFESILRGLIFWVSYYTATEVPSETKPELNAGYDFTPYCGTVTANSEDEILEFYAGDDLREFKLTPIYSR